MSEFSDNDIITGIQTNYSISEVTLDWKDSNTKISIGVQTMKDASVTPFEYMFHLAAKNLQSTGISAPMKISVKCPGGPYAEAGTPTTTSWTI